MFKSPNNYRYLGMEVLSQEVLNSLIKFCKNITGEITARAYRVFITDVLSDFQQISNGSLLIIKNYILGLIWKNQCFFLFDWHSKEEIGRMPATGTADLLKFDSLSS